MFSDEAHVQHGNKLLKT